MSITLAEAGNVLKGAIIKAEELDIKINVAVCDAGGRLVAFARMDGGQWGGVYGAQGKAIAASAFGRASGVLEAWADLPIIRSIVANEGGHMILHQGALPIIRDGVVIGACGVGGGTAQEDEDCAKAGLDTL